jgi:D-glycero-alpha-D-manno-heptose 1-phosphate guanylyltransferase
MTSAIILAGGLGTRLRDAVPDLPKPMAPLNGRPFLEYQIDYWISQGVRHFILSIGYRSEAIVSHFGETYGGARLEYAVEAEPLGTGGGLLLAMGLLASEDAFLLLNGDTFFEVSLDQLVAFHSARQSDWTLALFRTREVGRYMGPGVDGDGRILSLRSETGNAERLANGGVYLVTPHIIRSSNLPAGQRVSLEDEIMPGALAAGGRFFGMECEGRFIDIGVPEDYRRAADFVAGPEAAP